MRKHVYQALFSLPMHESLGTRLLAKQTSPQNFDAGGDKNSVIKFVD